ncbi:MAG TPA: PD-(D/E)XK nuclease family protein [Thermomicrobiaceae bacterium]|nr:PD-(D/E)XK nuclease family protein [Thermomicrobiaceae bacterium]
MSQVLTLTPTMLEAYSRCPSLYSSRYVVRQRSSEPPSPALARGNAAHAVLAELFDLFCGSGAFPLDLYDRVATRLPREPYDSDTAHAADVDEIVRWVKGALHDFDGTARVVAVEEWLEYQHRGADGRPLFKLRCRLDLVLRHDDGTITVVNWKSSSSGRTDPIATMCATVVAGATYGVNREIQAATVFLPVGLTVTEVLTREQRQAAWREIRRLAQAIDTDRTWQPLSNALCPYCPRFHHDCPLHPQPLEDDSMRDWLEGAGEAAG